MTIEEKVQALLVANSGVTAIAAAVNINPLGDWQNKPMPRIVHFPIAANTQRTHDGLVLLKEWDYQVSCFADTYPRARALSAAVVAAIDGLHGDVRLFWQDQAAQFEANPPVHHIALDFQVFEAL